MIKKGCWVKEQKETLMSYGMQTSNARESGQLHWQLHYPLQAEV